MKKKWFSLAAMIVTAAYLAFSVTPVAFLVSYWENDYPGKAISATKKYSYLANMFSIDESVLAGIVVGLCVISIGVFILYFIDKPHVLTKYGICAPVIAPVVFVVLGVLVSGKRVPNGGAIVGYEGWGYYGQYSFDLEWGFYIECILLIIVCVISILLWKGKLVNAPKKNVVDELISSPTDGLKKYKELLDLGAITEEEYMAKKKQVLGLPSTDYSE